MADLMKVERKVIELNGYLKGVNEATKSFLHIIEGIKIEPNVGEDSVNELHDKCQTCVNKVKYQDDVPCCDCDPAGKASGYKRGKEGAKKLYAVEVFEKYGKFSRIYFITGNSNSNTEKIKFLEMYDLENDEFIKVEEIETTVDGYRIEVKDTPKKGEQL